VSERIFAQTLPPKWAVLSTTPTKIWLSVGPFFRSFGHNSLVSCPFSARKVSNRSSHHILQNGQGEVSSIQLSVWSTVRSNLGQTLVNPSQTWSTLVKLGQTLGNVSRTFFLGVFEVMSPRRNRPTWFGLPCFTCRHPRKSRG
jgi:hypothetical protein